jgi:hypothetical protein
MHVHVIQQKKFSPFEHYSSFIDHIYYISTAKIQLCVAHRSIVGRRRQGFPPFGGGSGSTGPPPR